MSYDESQAAENLRGTASSSPESLDGAIEYEWRQLAEQVLSIRRGGENCSRTNVTLGDAADREPEAPTAPVYRLWAADNLASDGDYESAVRAYDVCVVATQTARPMSEGQDLLTGAMLHKGQASSLNGDERAAIATYRDLIMERPADRTAPLDAGLASERIGDPAAADEFYRSIASVQRSMRTDDPAQLALRALERLNTPDVHYSRAATDLADRLTTALERRDTALLQALASKTHFAIGPTGGHTGFEDLALLDTFLSELSTSDVVPRRALLGSGSKRYLPSSGWKGAWFQGDVSLILSEAPGGWQWTGIALGAANDRWHSRWTPEVIETNQPLPFEIRAPWPKDQCFTAGGLWEHIAEAAIVAASWPFGALVAGGLAAASCCGWGPRGFYYNIGPTHDQANAFAIDFTRYRRFVPYDNESGGTPVLAVREGIVSRVDAGRESGDATSANRVEVEHADPDAPADLRRFTSKYLHLEGPFRIPVSQGMPIRLGTHLGFMDDTGTSILDHLHFSIHDRQLTHPNESTGRSVRPSPMSGVTLGDSDSNKCVESTNVDYRGTNQLLFPRSFAGQNWLITPAASAVSEAPPSDPEEQLWLLVLSGVVIIDFQGNSSKWLGETALISPDIFTALNHAINRHNVPTPSVPHRLRFQVELWAPHVAPSSMFNRNHSVNSGFAVDRWRPHPFETDTDPVSNSNFGNIFSGVQVDLAVRDVDAVLHRVSYHISLLGKIRFGQPIIID